MRCAKSLPLNKALRLKVHLIPFPVQSTPDVALCVFRIVQEALRNVKKHSGASRAQVILHLAGSTIHLSVCDQGVGFNRKESYEERRTGHPKHGRARTLAGWATSRFNPEPGTGTKVDVCAAAANKINNTGRLRVGRNALHRRP